MSAAFPDGRVSKYKFQPKFQHNNENLKAEIQRRQISNKTEKKTQNLTKTRNSEHKKTWKYNMYHIYVK